MGQPCKTCLHGEKSSHLSEILPALRWDLTWVGWIGFHVNDLFLQSEMHHSADISIRWDVSPGWDGFSHLSSSRSISKFMTPSTGKLIITIHILSSILRSKRNQIIKLGQVIECNIRNIFLEKSYTKWGGEIIPRPFSEKYNWVYLWIYLKSRTAKIYWNCGADHLLLPDIKVFLKI